MAAKALGKARDLQVGGLTGISVPSPVFDFKNLQINGDGTISVIVDFYQDQATFDAGGDAFHTENFQVNAPANLETLIITQLKLLPDFDAVV